METPESEDTMNFPTLDAHMSFGNPESLATHAWCLQCDLADMGAEWPHGLAHPLPPSAPVGTATAAAYLYRNQQYVLARISEMR